MKLKTLVNELKKKGYQLSLDRVDNVLSIKKLVDSEDVGYELVAMLSTDGVTLSTEFEMFRNMPDHEKNLLTNDLLEFIGTPVNEREVIENYSLKVTWLTGVKVKYLGYAENERIFVTEGKRYLLEQDIVEMKKEKNVPVESMTLVCSLNNMEFPPYTWTIENDKIVDLRNFGSSYSNEVII